jgi:hypothetical protein
MFTRIASCALVCALPVAAQDPGPMYRASVAAAEATLRLHETAVAKKWLAAAPESERGWEWHYLQRLVDRSAARLPAHSAAVTDVALSRDGAWIATAGADGTAKLWDARTRALRHALPGHTGPVWSAVFSPDGATLAMVPLDKTVVLLEGR